MKRPSVGVETFQRACALVDAEVRENKREQCASCWGEKGYSAAGEAQRSFLDDAVDCDETRPSVPSAFADGRLLGRNARFGRIDESDAQTSANEAHLCGSAAGDGSNPRLESAVCAKAVALFKGACGGVHENERVVFQLNEVDGGTVRERMGGR